MTNKAICTIFCAAGLLGSTQTVSAENMSGQAAIIHDSEMRLIFLRYPDVTQLDDGRHVFKRALIDYETGFRCDWKSAAKVNFDTGDVSNIQRVELKCRRSNPADEALAVRQGTLEIDKVPEMQELPVFREIDDEKDVLVETRIIHTAVGISQVFTRTWDADEGLVCAVSHQIKEGSELPFMITNFGCRNINQKQPDRPDIKVRFTPLGG